MEDYVPRSDNLSPYQVIEKLGRANGMVKEYEYVKYDSSKAEHWELSDVGYDSEIQVTLSLSLKFEKRKDGRVNTTMIREKARFAG